MAFFTTTIYNAIMLSVSGGDISPLVGHNAFLRWEYMKQCAFQSEDGQTKYWSDAHVSEDFDIAIRFQVNMQLFALSSLTSLRTWYIFPAPHIVSLPPLDGHQLECMLHALSAALARSSVYPCPFTYQVSHSTDIVRA